MYRLGVILGGYALAAVTLGLWLNARDNLAAQIEACNSQKQQAVAEAERVAREAADSAHAARLAQLEAQAASEKKAREIAEEARREAESRPARVRTVIRESTDGCLEAPIPSPVLDSLRLRPRGDRGEADSLRDRHPREGADSGRSGRN